MHGPPCSVILTRLEKQARIVITEKDLVYVNELMVVYRPIGHLELPLSFSFVQFRTLLMNYIPTYQTTSLRTTYQTISKSYR